MWEMKERCGWKARGELGWFVCDLRSSLHNGFLRDVGHNADSEKVKEGVHPASLPAVFNAMRLECDFLNGRTSSDVVHLA
mmetsp:Transcript_18908/g.57127  ORF Transcript_18908/g.57127 Transcript_18908/m.57127 type:complete len:80 (-) Transcript_18908:2101-2340(-)